MLSIMILNFHRDNGGQVLNGLTIQRYHQAIFQKAIKDLLLQSFKKRIWTKLRIASPLHTDQDKTHS